MVDGALYFRIENSVATLSDSALAFGAGGIGLANVKRRLGLVYPDRHLLAIEPMQELFRVSLQLRLDNLVQTTIAV